MTTSKDVHPLLIEPDTTSLHPFEKLKKKRICKISLIISSCILLIAVIIISIIWPFGESEQISAGIYGKYPVWGGNIKNQQISLNSVITSENVADIKTLCIYNGSETDISLSGYITVDNDNYGYFGDTSGYIRSIDLNTCQTKWSVLLNDILNYDGIYHYNVLNTASLYTTSNGQQGILFGTSGNNRAIYDCYAIALNTNDGSLIWKTLIANSTYCRIHGFMIDGSFAFGGMSSGSDVIPTIQNTMFIGRLNKINLNNGEIINEWYSLPQYNETMNYYEMNGFYSGGSIYPLPAIIDEYIVFGTGNLFTYPRRVEQCMFGNTSSIPIENVYEYDLCPEDMRENHLNWRCLETNIMSDSLVILNKHSLKQEIAIPVAGVDAANTYCAYVYNINREAFYAIPDCPKRIPPIAPTDFTAMQPNIDAAAIATYHDSNGQAYAAVAQKSGQFYIVEIPSGEVKVIKKVGPWSSIGGLAPFNMAVDEQNMIGIVSIIGTSGEVNDFMPGIYYRYKMADNTTICGFGSVHVIDLNTGYTVWQWINPYSVYSSCNDTMYDDYVDITVDGTCERGFNGLGMLPPKDTVINVVTPPIDNDVRIPMDVEKRGRVIGPVTISNNMVFIPIVTGDIFVHDILTGDFIHRLQCPNYNINTTLWNRAGIRSGITIFEDRIIFYCGSSSSDGQVSAYGNQVISMKLPTFTK
eukprot:199558_1